jgi:Acyl-protein synthetase, LuxE
MNKYQTAINKVFSISSEQEFNESALEIFRLQYKDNRIYHAFVDAVRPNLQSIDHFSKIPFLPIGFFKKHKIVSKDEKFDLCFESSGTTASVPSKHFVSKKEVYQESFQKGFELFYGKPDDYTILALLPSYLERSNSSLVFMVNELIQKSAKMESGFYLDNLEDLHSLLLRLKTEKRKVFLIGVSFALLELAEKFPISFPELILMETGGMKGRRKELLREELHAILKQAFCIEQVHSEYGMTELLSQAYAAKDGRFSTLPWMKILIRDMNDPLSLETKKSSGGINVIDLANIYSCSFIATQDLGRSHANGTFEVLGRFDDSEVRGCNLMVV